MDIILIVVLLIGALIGYKVGFVNCIFGLIGGILAIVLTLFTYKPVAAIVAPAWGWDTAIYGFVDGIAEKTGTNEGVFSSLFGDVTGTDVIVGQGSNDIIASISNFIINMLVMGGLFIIYSLIIIIIKKILNGIASLPIIDAINGLAGAATGLVESIILVLIAFAIIFFLGTIGKAQGVVDMIEKSYASKYIYDNNIIVKVLINSNFNLQKENVDIENGVNELQ